MKTDDEIRNTIRNNLKQLRIANHKTQLDIAKLTKKAKTLSVRGNRDCLCQILLLYTN